ncbi:MAG: adenine deaminase, partial [Sutterella sp.]|nr:adenine deaminase [Sutterella sp.]
MSLLRRRIDCAMGRALCEVLIKKATIADVANGKIIHDVDIAVDAGCIVDIGRHLKARALHVREAREGIYVPGFIDSHVHIESSFLSPAGFSDLVLPFGTTTAVV